MGMRLLDWLKRSLFLPFGGSRRPMNWLLPKLMEILAQLKEISTAQTQLQNKMKALAESEASSAAGITRLEKKMDQVLVYLTPPPATQFTATVKVDE
jgi:hypothetical protein